LNFKCVNDVCRTWPSFEKTDLGHVLQQSVTWETVFNIHEIKSTLNITYLVNRWLQDTGISMSVLLLIIPPSHIILWYCDMYIIIFKTKQFLLEHMFNVKTLNGSEHDWRCFVSIFFIEIQNFRGEGKILMRYTYDTTFSEKIYLSTWKIVS
jgi:hypothetical protein